MVFSCNPPWISFCRLVFEPNKNLKEKKKSGESFRIPEESDSIRIGLMSVDSHEKRIPAGMRRNAPEWLEEWNRLRQWQVHA